MNDLRGKARGKELFSKSCDIMIPAVPFTQVRRKLRSQYSYEAVRSYTACPAFSKLQPVIFKLPSGCCSKVYSASQATPSASMI